MTRNILYTLFLIQLFYFHIYGSLIPSVNGNKNAKTIIDTVISETIKEANLPDSIGLSIAFIQDNQIVYKQSSGFCNLEYQIRNNPNTPIPIASLAKQFTAYGIALLLREGKLSLDDTLSRFLPGFPPYGNKITIRHLIHHISGVKDQWSLMSLAGYSSEDSYSQERVMKAILNQQELNFEPGTEFLYSNSNYTLLAAIIEKVSGERFGKWMRNHVFEPIGMSNTSFIDTPGVIIPNYAQSYDFSAGSFRKQALNLSCVGPSGMVSSLDDLCKWTNHLNTWSSKGSSITALIETVTTLNDGKTIPYAFGQGVKSDGKTALFYHDGSEAGYRSFLGRIPALGLGIILLANCNLIDPEKLAMKILSRLSCFGSDLPVFREGPDTSVMKLSVHSAKWAFNKLAGDYRVNGQISFRIWEEQQGLKFQVFGKNDQHAISFVSSDTLIVPALQLRIIPLEDQNGNIDKMKISMKDQSPELTAVRVSTTDIALLPLPSYRAVYHSSELDITYSIKDLGDHLIVSSNRIEDIYLQRIDQDRFIGNQWFFKDVLFQRNANGAITGFTVSSNRARNNHFKKL